MSKNERLDLLKKSTTNDLNHLIISCLKNAEDHFDSAEIVFSSNKSIHSFNNYVISFEELAKAIKLKDLYDQKRVLEIRKVGAEEKELFLEIDKTSNELVVFFSGRTAHESKITLGLEKFKVKELYELFQMKKINADAVFQGLYPFTRSVLEMNEILERKNDSIYVGFKANKGGIKIHAPADIVTLEDISNIRKNAMFMFQVTYNIFSYPEENRSFLQNGFSSELLEKLKDELIKEYLILHPRISKHETKRTRRRKFNR